VNALCPKVGRRLVIFLGLGLIAIFAQLWVNGEERTNEILGPGRALLETKTCNGDTILPLIPYENTWPINTRAVLYLLFLGWLFLGVAISADCFMAAIEVITSQTHMVQINGEEVEVEVWNSTVANLTLMALGSSAPEILLAVVETVSLKFEAGALGPGCIVGSAAFNLLFITAICISCLPESEDDPSRLDSRMIEEFGVFVITAVASLFAYLWMVITLSWVGSDVISPTEAVLTLIMFPLLVWVSWAQDNNWWNYFESKATVSPEEGHQGTRGRLKSIHTSSGTWMPNNSAMAGILKASSETNHNPLTH